MKLTIDCPFCNFTFEDDIVVGKMGECPKCKKKFIGDSIGDEGSYTEYFFPDFNIGENMKKILVTAGGTQEYIDDVRVLTNISTGKLGALITNELCEAGFKVYYVCGKNSVMPNDSCYYVETVKTANDAMVAMKRIIIDNQIDAVIHSMAVSDFTFKRDSAIKCKSNDLEGFIDFMRQTIAPNPKIISMIKQWRPEVLLAGFKFEVGLDENELITLAQTSIEKNGCDFVVANDKKEMEKMNSHVARFVFSENLKHLFKDVKVSNKDEIAKTIRHVFEVLLKF